MAEEVKQEVKEEYDIDTLLKNAFEQQEKNPYIKCILWGPTGCGKTYCSMTFPEPVRVIDLDGGLLINLKYFKDKSGNPTKSIQRIQCLSHLDDVAPLKEGEQYDWKKVDPINSLRNFDVALSTLQKVEGGTVVIDTMTAYNDWLKMEMEARGPKKVNDKGVEYIDQIDWKFVNQKWAWAWEKLKNIKANLVIIAREKPVYQGREITDQVEADLRVNSDYNADVVIKFEKKIEQVGTTIETKRFASFGKFRGNKLGSTYIEENLGYERIMEILKTEEQV